MAKDFHNVDFDRKLSRNLILPLIIVALSSISAVITIRFLVENQMSKAQMSSQVLLAVGQYHAQQEELIGMLRGVLLIDDPHWIEASEAQMRTLNTGARRIQSYLADPVLQDSTGAFKRMRQEEERLFTSCLDTSRLRPPVSVTNADLRAYIQYLDKHIRPQRKLTQENMTAFVSQVQDSLLGAANCSF